MNDLVLANRCKNWGYQLNIPHSVFCFAIFELWTQKKIKLGDCSLTACVSFQFQKRSGKNKTFKIFYICYQELSAIDKYIYLIPIESTFTGIYRLCAVIVYNKSYIDYYGLDYCFINLEFRYRLTFHISKYDSWKCLRLSTHFSVTCVKNASIGQNRCQDFEEFEFNCLSYWENQIVSKSACFDLLITKLMLNNADCLCWIKLDKMASWFIAILNG